MHYWNPLSLNEKKSFDIFLKENDKILSDYSFVNLWMWNTSRKYETAIIDHFFCIRFFEDEKLHYLFPIGKGDKNTIVEKLIQSTTGPFFMRAIPEFEKINYPLTPEPDRFDYIYSFQDLISLSGNLYQAKRNLIHQFADHYTYEYLSIDKPLLEQVKIMQAEWAKKNPSLAKENEAILRLFENYSDLNVLGGALLVNGEVIAYTIGEYLANDTLLIHIEKAFKDYKGAYQMINHEFLLNQRPVAFVNREEDLGIDNLKKMKESYHPIRLEKKYKIELKP